MLLIRKRAYARAGLIGNPSDGYNGKTISIIIRLHRMAFACMTPTSPSGKTGSSRAAEILGMQM